MGLETGVNYIDDLNASNPDGADNPNTLDNHDRLIKTAVKGSFPSLGQAAVTKTAAEINDLATLTGTETLTNKTLTSPVVDAVYDSNGNVQVDYAVTAGAVNYLQFYNNTTGNDPTIGAGGIDTNLDIVLFPKGTGTVISTNGFQGFLTGTADTANAVANDGVVFNTDVAIDTTTGSWSSGVGTTLTVPRGIYIFKWTAASASQTLQYSIDGGSVFVAATTMTLNSYHQVISDGVNVQFDAGGGLIAADYRRIY